MEVVKVLLVICSTILWVQGAKNDDIGRPYEFGFTIDGEQHRHEKKDANGIIQGEFGFITADGVYHVTVYATDENGSFRILSMRNIKISPPLDGSKDYNPSNAEYKQPKIPGQSPETPGAPAKLQSLPSTTTIRTTIFTNTRPPPVFTTPKGPYRFTTQSTIKPGCASCGYVTPPPKFEFQNPAGRDEKQQNLNQPPSYPTSNQITSSPPPPPPFPPANIQNLNQPPSYPTSNQITSPPPPPPPPLFPPANIQNLNQPSSYQTSNQITNSPPPPPLFLPPNFQNPNPPGFPPSPQSQLFTPNYPNPESELLNPSQSPQELAVSQNLNQFPQPPSSPPGSQNAVLNQTPNSQPPGQNLQPSGFSPNNQNQLGQIPQPPTYNQNPPPSFQNPTGLPIPVDTLQPPGTGGQASTPPPVIVGNPNYPEFGNNDVSEPPGPPSYNQNPPQQFQSLSPISRVDSINVSNGVINVPNNSPIKIQDKYPGMVDGLPDGITEGDITDLLYKFNYTVGFHGHYEKGWRNGTKTGGYFVNGRDGISRIVTYVADEFGYRPKFRLVNLGLDSSDTPKESTEKKFGLKNFEFVWYPLK